MDSDSMYKENLEEWIYDEGKLVTYHYLSVTLGVSINLAKQMLYEFYTEEKTKQEKSKKSGRKIRAMFLVSGVELKSDESSELMKYTLTLCPDYKLDEHKSKLKELYSVHIYSLESSQEDILEQLNKASLETILLKDLEGRCGVDFGPYKLLKPIVKAKPQPVAVKQPEPVVVKQPKPEPVAVKQSKPEPVAVKQPKLVAVKHSKPEPVAVKPFKPVAVKQPKLVAVKIPPAPEELEEDEDVTPNRSRAKRRYRIESDSEEDDDFQEPKPHANPPPSMENGKGKVSKTVSKTYLKDDGFMLTVKEQVLVSASDESESEREPPSKFLKTKDPSDSKKPVSSARKDKPASPPPKKRAPKKLFEKTFKEKNSDSQKMKQASLTSFFKKKP